LSSTLPRIRHGIVVCLALLSVWSAAAYSADDEHAPADSTMSTKMKAAGAAARHDAKAVETAVKEGAEKVKVEAKKASHEVAEAAKKGAHEAKVVAKEIAEKTKKAVQHGTGDHSDKPREP
jgi:hypothetical protein